MALVKDWMSRDFERLKGDMSLSDAIALLEGGSYGVIENANEQAIGVVTVADLEKAISQNATLPVQEILTSATLLTVGCDVEMQAVANSLWLTALVRSTKNALVLNDENRVAGVLTIEAVQKFIQGGSSQQKGTTLSDSSPYVAGSQLAGSRQALTGQCFCDDCGYVNELSKAEWDSLQANPRVIAIDCKNPDSNVHQHRLKLI